MNKAGQIEYFRLIKLIWVSLHKGIIIDIDITNNQIELSSENITNLEQ